MYIREFCQTMLPLICMICLCGCAGSRQGKIEPISGTELQAWMPSSIGEKPYWQVLATSAEIEYFTYSSERYGSTEIWLQFSAEGYRKLLKRLADNLETRQFRIVMNGQVVCTFVCYYFTSIGHPDLCILLPDPKEARRVLDSLRGRGVSVMPIVSNVEPATNAASLVDVKSSDYGDTNCLMRVVELDRIGNTSELRFTWRTRESFVCARMFVMSAIYEVAKARGMEYFINLKEMGDSDGANLYIAGFTNTKDADIRKEFGPQYNPYNEYGQARGYMSVSQWQMLFGIRPKK